MVVPTVQERLQALVRERSSRVLSCLDRAARKPDEPAVHDLRVACRRMDATLEMLKSLGGRVGKPRRRVRKLRKLAGPLRDLHVLEVWLADQRGEWPSLDAILVRLPRQIKRTAKDLVKDLNGYPRKKLKRALAQVVVPEEADEPAILESLERVESDWHERVRRKAPWHEVRIALKRYRYQAELVAALGLGQPDLEQLRHGQDLLGQVQDLEVQSERLEEFWRKSVLERMGIHAFVTHCRSQRDQLIQECARAFASV